MKKIINLFLLLCIFDSQHLIAGVNKKIHPQNLITIKTPSLLTKDNVREMKPHLQYRAMKLDGDFATAVGELKTNFRLSDGTLVITPERLRSAYHVDPRFMPTQSKGGNGETIAIIDAYGSPTLKNDLAYFNSTFNLPPLDLEIHYMDTSTANTDPNNVVHPGWAVETTLDVEASHSIAPEAKILLVVAKAPTTQDLLDAIDYAVSRGVHQVSMSFGMPESQAIVQYEQHFIKDSIIFVASAGDDGRNFGWPASSPHVLAVGGTSLYIDIDQEGEVRKVGEATWTGGGTGQSTIFPIPEFQQNWVSPEISQAGGRIIPDVSAIADPHTGFSVIMNQQLIVVGGTSLAAPVWAGVIAQINALRATKLRIDGLHRDLYNHNRYAQYFNDITNGCVMGFFETKEYQPFFCAHEGFDLVTGLGSPKIDSIIEGLMDRND